MTKQVNKYRIFCNTDNQFYETWSESLPTSCPIGHSNLNHSLTTVIDSVSENQVYIASKTYTSTNGYYQMKGLHFSFEEGEDSKTVDVVYPFSICVVGLFGHTNQSQYGDSLNVIVSPDTIVGITTQSVSIGDSIINVSQTVVENVLPGFNLTIDDHDLGQVKSVDKAAMTVTLMEPIENEIGPGSYVFLNIYIVRDFHFTSAGKYDIGYGMSSTKPVPPNTIIRLIYKRNNTLQKDSMSFGYEYTY